MLRTKSRSLDDIQIVSNGSTDTQSTTQHNRVYCLITDKDIDTMERAMYMERMAEYRRAKATQNSINIQLYSEQGNKLHEDSCNRPLDDPPWGEVERTQDPKGLMIAVTRIVLLSSSGNLHHGFLAISDKKLANE